MSSSNCCFLTYTQISQEAGEVVWYSHLFKNYSQFVVTHTVKGLSIVNETEVNIFLELFCFLCDPISSVQFSHSVMSNSLQIHESQHVRPPCPSPTARVYTNQCPLSQWCHPTISSSVVPFSSCPQSLPASGSFPMSQLFPSGGQRIGVSTSTSVLPMNTQDWCPLGWTGWIYLQSKGLSRVFFNTTVLWHSAFFIVQILDPYMWYKQ